MFGYQPQEVCGKKTSLIYADPQDFRNQGILRYNAEARDVLEPYEIKYKRKNGEVFDSETSGTPVRDSGDNVIGLLGIIRDISKRKEAENKLKKSEDDFRNLFENSPVSLWEEDFSELKTFLDNLNPDIKQNLKQHFEENPGVLERCVGSIKINKVNKQTLRLYGISSQQHFISSLYKIFTEKSYQTFIEGVCWLYEKGSTFITETVQKTNDGNLIDVYFETSIAPGHEETWDKVYVSIIDITPQKKAENELREHRDHLKELVAEKTAEINEKYNELQHQYSIMVGREFRIKELRDTVKELRRKLRNYENNI
jgi:PAS domain S-box-containing protein